jgi:hypothetical protein
METENKYIETLEVRSLRLPFFQFFFVQDLFFPLNENITNPFCAFCQSCAFQCLLGAMQRPDGIGRSKSALGRLTSRYTSKDRDKKSDLAIAIENLEKLHKDKIDPALLKLVRQTNKQKEKKIAINAQSCNMVLWSGICE